ncbi:hypothetical protein [Methanothermobacter tenebrarum]|uniref:PepSY domain-containing protein n=1 Tax=Methanothermobacter tenebrarum TaxID=680118 RepID=A0A328PJ72_9EURY|nr:hypothetical protein [Methanothermobacter tenebrarum]MBC7117698.1 hypothetical protein [Methanobacteriaceae archaeon]NPV64146.1 hypothetical protein [Methanobacteriaceae archaeon]RAO79766.1 hypothetical protein DPC56_00295 [Methanothermobacter tenebrarum]
MDSKYILLALVIIIILILVGGIFYFSKEEKENITQNVTKPQEIQNNQTVTTSGISAEEAQNIAANYMAANPAEFGNTTTGTPSLRDGVYYVPVVVITSEGQHPPGTIVAYIRVDEKTGTILGIEPIKMY